MSATTADRLAQCEAAFNEIVTVVLGADVFGGDAKEAAHRAFDILNTLWDTAYAAGKADAVKF